MKDGSLNEIIKEHVKESKLIPNETIHFWSIQLLKAIDFLHSNGIWHRDIKPANVFMHSNREKLVLGDLGLARNHNIDKSISSMSTLGTVYYKAPEFFSQDSNSNDYSEKIDIWYLLYFQETINLNLLNKLICLINFNFKKGFRFSRV